MRALLFAAGLLLLSACTGVDSSTVQITHTALTPTTSSTGSFDDVEIDQANHRLYAADRDRGIDVFDISSPHAAYLRSIPLPASPNGLAIAPDLGRLYAGTTGGAVEVVDIGPKSATAATVIAEIPTGAKETDLLDYSAARHELFASDGADGSITAIDARSGAVGGHFKVGYALEQPRFDPADGMLYVTSPDADALFRIDPTSGAVKNKFVLGACQPFGMAINPRSDQALIACKNWVLGWDLRSGTPQTFNEASHGDVVGYDAKIDRFLVAAPLTISTSTVALFAGNPIAYVSSVVTGGGGNAAAYDETNDVVYTTDMRPGRAGLAGFRPPDGTPALSSLLTLAPLAALLPVMVLVLFIVGRQADPIRRPEPLLTREQAKRARLEHERAHDPGQA